MKSLLVTLLFAFVIVLAITESRSTRKTTPEKELCREVRSEEGDDDDPDVDWYKNLNNLISVAAHNLLVSGEFLAVYPFSSLARVPEKNSCNRELNFDPLKPEKFKNPLKNIYNTGIIKIGVTSLLSLPYFSNATGTPQGFFYDLGNSLANEIAFILRRTLKAKFVTFQTSDFFGNATKTLATGAADTIIGMSYLVPRTLATDYSCWYEGPSPFAVYRDLNRPLPTGFTQPTTLSGWNDARVKVATLAGSIFETAAKKFLPNAQFVNFPTMNAAYDSVGVSTDIVFSITGETDGYNEAHGLRLTIQPNTLTTYGGGNAFATHKLPV